MLIPPLQEDGLLPPPGLRLAEMKRNRSNTSNISVMEKDSQITQISIQGGSDRIETGAVRFNDDWPGLFIRGDDAFALMLELKHFLKALEEQENRECLTYVVRRMVSIIEHDVIIRNDS